LWWRVATKTPSVFFSAAWSLASYAAERSKTMAKKLMRTVESPAPATREEVAVLEPASALAALQGIFCPVADAVEAQMKEDAELEAAISAASKEVAEFGKLLRRGEESLEGFRPAMSGEQIQSAEAILAGIRRRMAELSQDLVDFRAQRAALTALRAVKEAKAKAAAKAAAEAAQKASQALADGTLVRQALAAARSEVAARNRGPLTRADGPKIHQLAVEKLTAKLAEFGNPSKAQEWAEREIQSAEAARRAAKAEEAQMARMAAAKKGK